MSWFYPTLAPDGSSLIVQAATPPEVTPRRISVVQIDAATHRVTILAIGQRPSVFWGTGRAGAGKDKSAIR